MCAVPLRVHANIIGALNRRAGPATRPASLEARNA